MKVKEEIEKAGLKLNIHKMKIMAPGPITSCQIDGKAMETVNNFTFLGSKITSDGAWRIPGRREPGGPLSMGLHRVGHD